MFLANKGQSKAEISGKRLKPLNPRQSAKEKQKKQSTVDPSKAIDKFFEENLKDYGALLNYCLKLIDENQELLSDNLELRQEGEAALETNMNLFEENSILKMITDKIINDNLAVIEFNEQLHEEKNQWNLRCLNLQEKLQAVIDYLPEEAKSHLIKHSEIASLE